MRWPDAMGGLAILLLAAPTAGGAQGVVPDAVLCEACEIRTERIAVLGADPDGPALSRLSSVAMDSDGWFYVGSTYEPGELAVFDPVGRYERSFGRQGQGPGEFSGPIMRVAVGPGDSVHVIERVRHSVLAPKATEFVRLAMLSVSPGSFVFTDSGTLMVNGRVQGIGVGGLVHILSRDGRVRRSFVDAPAVDNPYSGALRRVLAHGRDGTVWIGEIQRYAIEEWSAEAGQLRGLRREAPWFEEWSGAGRPLEETRLAAMLQNGRLLWTLVLVPDPYAPQQPVAERPVLEVDLNELYDTVVEAIDLEARRVVARRRFDEHLHGFLANRPVVYRRTEGVQGEILVIVHALRMERY